MKYLLAIISIVMISCSNDSSTNADNEGQEGIIPLQVGNTWNYETFLYDSVGTLANTDTEYREVISDTLIDGDRWFKTNFLAEYLSNRSDGLWQRNRRFFYTPENKNKELDEPWFRIPFPLKLNETKKVGAATYTLVEEDVTVEVPAGTFSCYVYRKNYSTSLGVPEYFVYYSPKVGLVKETWEKEYKPSDPKWFSYYSAEKVLKDYRVLN